MIRDHHKHI